MQGPEGTHVQLRDRGVLGLWHVLWCLQLQYCMGLWKLWKILKALTTRKNTVTCGDECKRTYWSHHVTVWTHIKSLCGTPETNPVLYVNCISVKKKRMETESWECLPRGSTITCSVSCHPLRRHLPLFSDWETQTQSWTLWVHLFALLFTHSRKHPLLITCQLPHDMLGIPIWQLAVPVLRGLVASPGSSFKWWHQGPLQDSCNSASTEKGSR